LRSGVVECGHFATHMKSRVRKREKCGHSLPMAPVGRYIAFFELTLANNTWLKPHLEESGGRFGIYNH